MAELNAFKAKCQGIVDAFYKKLEQLLSDSRTEVKRLEDENVQNFQQTEQLLQSMQSNEKP